MAAPSYGNFKWASVTHLEREGYNIPVLLLFREDNLWWCLSFEEILREFCTEGGDSSVQEAGEDGYGSGKVTYISGIRWIHGAKPIATPTIEMNSME